MQEEQPLDPPERELAEALGRLELGPVGSSPREIWYRAGLEAGRRRASAWRAVAGAVALAACLLLALILGRPAETVERVVYVPRRSPAPAVEMPPPGQETPPKSLNGYLRLCDALAQQGLDALPAGPAGGGGDAGDAPSGWPFTPADDLLPRRRDASTEKG